MNRLATVLILLLAGCPTRSSVLNPVDAASPDAADMSEDLREDAGVDMGARCEPANCDDGNPCTADSCEGGVCSHRSAEGLDCDDGRVCTTGDRCMDGVCTGTPMEQAPALLGQARAWGGRSAYPPSQRAQLVGDQRALFVRSGGGNTFLTLADLSTEPMTRQSELLIPGAFFTFVNVQEADAGPLIVNLRALPEGPSSGGGWSLHVLGVVDGELEQVGVTTLTLGARASSVAYRHAAYLCTDGGITIVDLRDPTRPLRAGELDVTCERLALDLHGEELLVSNGTQSERFDLRDPLVPAGVGVFPRGSTLTTSENFVSALDSGNVDVLARPDFRVAYSHAAPIAAAGLTPFGLVTSNASHLNLLDETNGRLLAFVHTDDTSSSITSVRGNGHYGYHDGHVGGAVIARVSEEQLEVRAGGAGFGMPEKILQLAPGTFAAISQGGVMPLDLSDPSAPVFGETQVVDLPMQGLVFYGADGGTNVGGLDTNLLGGTRYRRWDARAGSIAPSELALPATPVDGVSSNLIVQGKRAFHMFGRIRGGATVSIWLRVLELIGTDEGQAWSIAEASELPLDTSVLTDIAASEDGAELAILSRAIGGSSGPREGTLLLYAYAEGTLELRGSVPFSSVRAQFAVGGGRIVILDQGLVRAFVHDAGELRALPVLNVSATPFERGESVFIHGDVAYVAEGASLHVLHFTDAGLTLVDTVAIEDSIRSMVFGPDFAVASGANTVSVLQPYCPPL